MNWKRFSLPIRIAIAVVVGFLFFRWAASKMHSGEGLALRFDIGFEIAIALLFYAALLWVLFGLPLVKRAGEKAAAIYFGDESAMRVMPEYSVAQARLKEGRYLEAVAEYQKVIEQFPQDIHAHLQIAEIAVEKLNNFGLAELELRSALAKATTPDAVAMAAHRLADFYQLKLQQSSRAIEVMEQLQTRLPETKHALGAKQRIDLMKESAGREAPLASPMKIAFRATDEETLRRRRGY
jgi:tetratricopeptide (TPR) repeat protein